ncbi:DUF427 domain-containing protein [Cyclobacterium xiamenense]|jgi:uncharacterized protein (DUF427 family)|uniref:DUF427 domain-containing protein n=1 Tax=Cyclobacterium xiamenense TaxID=1297121 RepID=UPI0012B73F8F|nr:DUF427 domain-containing protein [Cyclobacterium xiamenense]
MKAIWNDKILAQSNDTIFLENNHYFPPESLNREFFKSSNHNTDCPWKGRANYYTIQIGEDSNRDAAWFYPEPKEAAKQIKNYVAFWKGVKVEE